MEQRRIHAFDEKRLGPEARAEKPALQKPVVLKPARSKGVNELAARALGRSHLLAEAPRSAEARTK